MARLPDRVNFHIYPENDTLFYLTVTRAKISFQVRENKVESLVLYQGGQEMKGLKIE